jgi:hypothetical protein
MPQSKLSYFVASKLIDMTDNKVYDYISKKIRSALHRVIRQMFWILCY